MQSLSFLCLLWLWMFFVPVAIVRAECSCKAVGESFLVTRLWTIVNKTWTDQDVIDEFDRGFAPFVTAMEGFEEYLSSTTGNSSTVLFYNIFSTRTLASAAQQAAKIFVQTGALRSVITPYQFTEDQMQFHITRSCSNTSNAGKYLSTRLWELKNESSMTTEGVSSTFEEGVGAQLSSIDGFIEQGGATVTAQPRNFLFSTYETAEGAELANQQAANFVASSDLQNHINKVVFTTGRIGFDYTCVTGGPLRNSVTLTSGAGTSHILAAIAVMSALAMWWI